MNTTICQYQEGLDSRYQKKGAWICAGKNRIWCVGMSDDKMMWSQSDLLRSPGVRAPFCWCALRTAWRLNRDHETPKLLVYDSGQDGVKLVNVFVRIFLWSSVIALALNVADSIEFLNINLFVNDLHIRCARTANQVEFSQQLLVLVLCFIDTPRYSALVREEILEFLGKISKESGFQPLKKNSTRTQGHHPEVSELSEFFFRAVFDFKSCVFQTDQLWKPDGINFETLPSRWSSTLLYRSFLGTFGLQNRGEIFGRFLAGIPTVITPWKERKSWSEPNLRGNYVQSRSSSDLELKVRAKDSFPKPFGEAAAKKSSNPCLSPGNHSNFLSYIPNYRVITSLFVFTGLVCCKSSFRACQLISITWLKKIWVFSY